MTGIERIDDKIVKEGDCWLWVGAYSFTGYNDIAYGRCWDGTKVVGVHRFMYKLFHGTIPSGFVVHHKCNNKLCVNPEHLALVTYKENVAKQSNWGHPRRKVCVR